MGSAGEAAKALAQPIAQALASSMDGRRRSCRHFGQEPDGEH